MKIGLREEDAIQYACESGLILDGFTVGPDHSVVLTERGKEYTYSKKRPEQREKREKEQAR